MSRPYVEAILPRGWAGSAADRVVLDQDGRHRRRLVLTGERGLAFLLDLPRAVQLRHGDGLKLNDGRIVEVAAAPERLLEIRARSTQHLVTLAWHLGNRHLAAQVETDRILIRYDHVIAHMLEHLGATVTAVTAPFDPENGAYGDPHSHAHGGHDHHN